MQTSPLPPTESLSHEARYALIERRLASLERTLRSMRAWMVARTLMALVFAAVVIGSSIFLARVIAERFSSAMGGTGGASIEALQAQLRDYQETMKALGQ